MAPKASTNLTDSLLTALLNQPELKLDFVRLGKDLGITSDGARKRMAAVKKKLEQPEASNARKVGKGASDGMTDSLLTGILKQLDQKLNFVQLGKDMGITTDGARKRLAAFKKRLETNEENVNINIAVNVKDDDGSERSTKGENGSEDEKLEHNPKKKEKRAAMKKTGGKKRARATSATEDEEESPKKKQATGKEGMNGHGGGGLQQRGRRVGSTKKVTAVLEQELLEKLANVPSTPGVTLGEEEVDEEVYEA